MKIVDWNELAAGERAEVLARPRGRSDEALRETVRGIVDRVHGGGWETLCGEALRIDGAAPERIAVAPAAKRARGSLRGEQVAAIELAAANVSRFHGASRPADVAIETMPGVTVRKVWRPIDRVGLYIPGGNAPLFSTLLMLAMPARAAGVVEIVVATPPRRDGGLDPAVAIAADLCGIDAVWTVGGAQAIAALAFGSGDILRCDKICGPGNAWVAEAKSQVAALPGGPAIDLPAGPSELMVIADASADAGMVAADLLSQAEHDAAAQVLLVTSARGLAEAVANEVEAQLGDLPDGGAARSTLAAARIILVNDLDAAMNVANAYAPEHLSLAVEDADALIGKVRHAGAVFAGHAAAETFGDYLAGSSHVLPTDGAARAWSGVGTASFMKAISVQTVSAAAARALAGPAALLARLEGLEAHARAAEARAAMVAA